jgi:hypothetical protein
VSVFGWFFFEFFERKRRRRGVFESVSFSLEKKIIAAAKFELVQKESIRPLRVEEF